MKRADGVWALVIAGAVCAVYYPAVHGPWLWDDGLEVARNPAVASASGWWSAWLRPAGMDYFPLKDSLLWLEWHLGGPRPGCFHLVSAGLHAANALLIWRLLRELGMRAAAAGALIFAVHPVAVESVAWIAEQKNGWSLAFGLLSVLAFLRSERSGGRWAYAGALLAFAAALLCKSTLVMLPVALLFLRWHREGRVTARTAAAVVPFFSLSAAAGLVTLWFQWHRAMAAGGLAKPAGQRLLQAAASIPLYLISLVFPAGLAPIYPPAHGSMALVGAVAVLAAATAAALFGRRSWGGPALACAGVSLLMLLPVLGFVPMSYLRIAPRADHLAYPALVGAAGLAAWAVGRCARAALGWGAAALVCALFAWTARAEAAHYADAESFWTWAVSCNERAWLAHNNLGQLQLQRGAAAAAAVHFAAAARWGPPSAEVHANLGAADEALGRRVDARGEFAQAVALDPQLAGARYDLGRSWLEAGAADRAAEQLRAAVRLDPGHAAAHNLLGLAYARLGEGRPAADEYRRALQANPALPEAHVNLGNWLARSGAVEAAEEEYRRALAADPGNAAARHNLEAAERYLGRGR